MIKLEDLLPCPFCDYKSGLEDSELGDHDGYRLFAIRCQNCGAYGPPADTIAGAREEWNKRVKEKEAAGE
jgi:Lar family restriction alleviation protein